MRHRNNMEVCFVLALCVDLSSISLKDRRIALVSLLDNIQDNSIIIFGKRFKIILVFADVKSKYIFSLFDKITATSPVDVSKLSMKNVSIAYKSDKSNFLWMDLYICQPVRKLLLSKLDCCTKRLVFLEFSLDKLSLQGSNAWFKVRRPVKGIDGYTLPIAFHDLEEYSVIVIRDNYYERPATPNERHTSYDGKDETRGPPTQKARYSLFSQVSTRLATFANSRFFTDPQIFAELGFFYKGQGDSVCCYECGVALSQWQKDDDPLLEHIRFSPDCRHLHAKLDPNTLQDYKAQFQKIEADEQSRGEEGVRQEKITSNAGRKIGSQQYASYNVRLSTFARFPAISGLNVHHVAAAGFYYTGHQDIVRCYACDGGVKRWEPGDDPWEEHFKWFPDCTHLKQSNYKFPRKEMKVEGSSKKSEDKPCTIDHEPCPIGSLAGRLDELNIGENKENNPQKQEAEPDMNTPAVLAVLEFGYSKEDVKMAVNKLRRKGQAKLTANGILQVLFSYEDTGIKLTPDDEKETKEHSAIISESRKIAANHVSSEEQFTSTKSNKNSTSDTQELGRLLEDIDELSSKMKCKRCKKKQKNILLLPCTHFCLCDQCSKEVSLCPDCWKPIKERVKTYIS